MSENLNPVPLIILLITVIMNIAAFKSPDLMNKWVLFPYRAAKRGSYWELVTSGFIHADFVFFMYDTVRDSHVHKEQKQS